MREYRISFCTGQIPEEGFDAASHAVDEAGTLYLFDEKGVCIKTVLADDWAVVEWWDLSSGRTVYGVEEPVRSSDEG